MGAKYRLLEDRRGDIGITIEDHVLFDVGEDVVDLVIPDGVQEIADNCCYVHTKLEQVKVSDSVRIIGARVFQGCHKTRFLIDFKNLAKIGATAFGACRHLPQEIVFSNNLTELGSRCFAWTSIQSVKFEGGLDYIVDHAFYSTIRLNSIVLPKNLQVIDDLAFSYCPVLKEIELPNTLREIRIGAFSSSGLTHIELPEGLIIVDAAVFSDCEALAEVSIPSTLRCLSDKLFLRCTALKRINYAGTKKEWNALSKSPSWDLGTNEYTIYCTDGTIN